MLKCVLDAISIPSVGLVIRRKAIMSTERPMGVMVLRSSASEKSHDFALFEGNVKALASVCNDGKGNGLYHPELVQQSHDYAFLEGNVKALTPVCIDTKAS